MSSPTCIRVILSRITKLEAANATHSDCWYGELRNRISIIWICFVEYSHPKGGGPEVNKAASQIEQIPASNGQDTATSPCRMAAAADGGTGADGQLQQAVQEQSVYHIISTVISLILPLPPFFRLYRSDAPLPPAPSPPVEGTSQLFSVTAHSALVKTCL